MEKTKIIGAWVGIIFGIVSTIALFLTGLSWVIGIHINPINDKLDNLINNDIKHITDDIKELNNRFDKMNGRFDKLYQILLKDKQNSK